ncbi:hypothetical protein [Vibrio phage vB_VmeM-Yong XC32]|nr:hypothetical protein [Vibrio phage vB_VmeM-Yong XC31]QAX96465.1 hypothetical protein [Vibrio phage vB_VmeM-Yong XC32]QAX96782.1 hypothetical protein [Vibrio phage vB_VmeM-Yong MS31]QAX97101.1 hypothetical protein [Vibrio phage vB_VmeM-Yong MS32]
MNIHQLANQLAREVQEGDEISMESFDSFFGYLSAFRNKLSVQITKLFNEDFKALDVTPETYAKLESLLSQKGLDYNDIAKVVIYRPEAMTSPMVDFTKELYQQFALMGSLQDRLYRPAISWFAQAASRDEFMEKVWKDKNLLMVDVEKLQKEMRRHYKNDRGREGPDMESVAKLYGSLRQFDQTQQNLHLLAEAGKQFDLKILKDAEETLSMHIMELIKATDERQEEGQEIKDIPEGTRKRLAEVLRHIAMETEYFSSLTFLATTAITSWNDSLAKIEAASDELKKEK